MFIDVPPPTIAVSIGIDPLPYPKKHHASGSGDATDSRVSTLRLRVGGDTGEYTYYPMDSAVAPERFRGTGAHDESGV